MRRSVLVVDDNREFRRLAGRLLAAVGLTVIGEVDSVAAALGAALELKPSAGLVDVELPDGAVPHPVDCPAQDGHPAPTRDSPGPTGRCRHRARAL